MPGVKQGILEMILTYSDKLFSYILIHQYLKQGKMIHMMKCLTIIKHTDIDCGTVYYMVINKSLAWASRNFTPLNVDKT